jgi:serpin B
MHFDLRQNQFHPVFNWLEQALASRGEGEGEEGFQLHVTNAFWGQKDYKFKVNFLDTLAENYGAGLRILDFIGNPDESRVSINDWVSDQTGKRIQELLAPSSITTDTRLVRTNAIYFKAAWQHKFWKKIRPAYPFICWTVAALPFL